MKPRTKKPISHWHERQRSFRPASPEKQSYTQEKPELLAPAGRAETFFAALDAGADAVYVGITDFNARMRAPNFSLEELSPLIAFAHERGRKVYVTLNTLIQERELPDVARVLDALRRMAPDALIIQDLGVYRLARMLAPEIPLHASTQMTIHNLDGALQAQRMGFERVILARELTLDEIRAIRASSTIALETFIHGALCFSISGQCLFSSYVHGASANRGRCMQPCRRVFQHGEREGCFFSTYDLNTAAILDQLIAAGIRSFKIEGRLKPAETIAQIVRAYRILIDAYPRITRDAVNAARRALDVAVGRAPSTGFYLEPRPERLVGGDASHAARDLGKAIFAGPRRFGLVSSHMIKTGDRLRVQISDKEPPRGFVVREMRAEGLVMRRSRPGQRVDIAAPFDVPAGARVLKMADTDALVKGAAKRIEKHHAEATRPSKAVFSGRFFRPDAKSARIEIRVGAETVCADLRLTWKGSCSPAEAARILAAEQSDSAVRLDVAAEGFDGEDVALGTGDLAGLRAKTLAAVAKALERQYAKALAEIGRIEPCGKPQDADIRIVRVASVEAALAVADEADDTVIVLPLSQIETEAFRMLRARKELAAKLILALPAFTFVAEKRGQIAAQVRRAFELGFSRFEVSNLSHFNMLQATGRRKLHVLVAPGIGCMNSQCHRQLRELGAATVAYAAEGDAENLRALAEHVPHGALAVQVYGHIPVFQTRAPRRKLPIGAVRLSEPEKGFIVRPIDDVTSVIPEAPFSLRDRLGSLRALGVQCFIYDSALDNAPAESLREAGEPAKAAVSRFNFERGLE